MLERADEPVGAALLAMAAQQQVGRQGSVCSWLSCSMHVSWRVGWQVRSPSCSEPPGRRAWAVGRTGACGCWRSGHAVLACRWPSPSICCFPPLPPFHQAAQLSPENILMREGTYRAIGECFPHLRTKVGRLQLMYRVWRPCSSSNAAAVLPAAVLKMSAPLLGCSQVDFGAWYASELRLILTSTELTGKGR